MSRSRGTVQEALLAWLAAQGRRHDRRLFRHADGSYWYQSGDLTATSHDGGTGELVSYPWPDWHPVSAAAAMIYGTPYSRGELETLRQSAARLSAQGSLDQGWWTRPVLLARPAWHAGRSHTRYFLAVRLPLTPDEAGAEAAVRAAQDASREARWGRVRQLYEAAAG